MSRSVALVLTAFIFLVLNLGHSCYSEVVWSTYSRAASALVQSVGFTGLSLSSECTATRNPILEPTCACLGDMPGGYCYHLSCGIVGIPVMTEEPNQIEVVHR